MPVFSAWCKNVPFNVNDTGALARGFTGQTETNRASGEIVKFDLFGDTSVIPRIVIFLY